MNRLVILAGGKSTRMGQDKVFLKTGEETFIERIYHNASYCFDEIFISTDSEEHSKKIKGLIPNANVITDMFQSIGPIGGILSVFMKTKVDGFCVVATDMPEAAMKVLVCLKQEAEPEYKTGEAAGLQKSESQRETDKVAVMLKTLRADGSLRVKAKGNSSENKAEKTSKYCHEPLLAYYKKEVVPLLEKAVEKKEYSIRRALEGNYKAISLEEIAKKYFNPEEAGIIIERFETGKLFNNINTKEEYEEYTNKHQ